jgi:3-oxoadipate enol-lactonase
MPFAATDELRTYYELTGVNGPVLVFSNSLGTNLSMWDPQMAEMNRHFRILRYDTRGQGQSSATAGEYTLDQLGRDVLHLLDALGLDRVHFCGLSMGGMIGMWLGIHAPDRLHRLVLCNTAARIGTAESWNARIEAVRKGGMKAVAAAVIGRWFTSEFREAFPHRVAAAQEMLEKAPPQGYTGCGAAIRDMDQREVVANIAAPTLVIYGGKDPVTAPSDAHFLAEKIVGSAELELNAAHLSNVEQPDKFTEAVANFCSK